MDKMTTLTDSVHSLHCIEKYDKSNRILYKVPRDHGLAWLIVLASFGANLIMAGITISAAVFLVEWYDLFDDAKYIISLIPALVCLTRAISSFFVGGLINQYGCCSVHFVGGLLCSVSFIIMFFAPGLDILLLASALQGVGIGFTQAPPVVIIYEYFDKNKSFASGISMVGQSLSAFVMIAIFRFSVDAFCWRGGTLIAAGVSLNQCVFAMIFISNIKSTPEKKPFRKTFNFSIVANKSLWLFAISASIQTALCDLLYILSPSRAVDKGFGRLQGSALLTCIGAASLCCRVLTSWLSNLKCSNHFILFSLFTFLQSGANILSCFLTFDFGPLAASAVIGGLGLGGSLTVVPACLVDLLGTEMLASSLGFQNAVSGVFRPLALPIGGLMYDLTNDFNMSFVFAACMGVVAAVIALTVACWEHGKITHTNTDGTDLSTQKDCA